MLFSHTCSGDSTYGRWNAGVLRGRSAGTRLAPPIRSDRPRFHVEVSSGIDNHPFYAEMLVDLIPVYEPGLLLLRHSIIHAESSSA